MMQRHRVLVRYFLQRLSRSVSGVLYLMLTFAYWLILFNPQQETPDADYFLIVIGFFGPLCAFLITLTVAGWANQAIHYPLLVRLRSRVEYLTAVMVTTFLATLSLQGLLAVLVLIFGGPRLTFTHIALLIPVWLSPMLLAIVLALHASDLVTRGWSRVYLFGLLALFLFGQGMTNESLVRFLNGFSEYATNQGWFQLVERTTRWSFWLSQNESNRVIEFFQLPFWPFKALTTAISEGGFTAVETIAPAILILYTTILFLIAADLFSNKDLQLAEA